MATVFLSFSSCVEDVTVLWNSGLYGEPPTLVCYSTGNNDRTCRLGSRGSTSLLLSCYWSAAVQMETGPGGRGSPLAPLVELPSWKKSAGPLSKLLWADHPPRVSEGGRQFDLIIFRSTWSRRAQGRGQQGLRETPELLTWSVTLLRLMVRCLHYTSFIMVPYHIWHFAFRIIFHGCLCA